MSPHWQTPFPGVRTLPRLSAWEHVYYLNYEIGAEMTCEPSGQS